ncbi:DUF484 family protein, partial [Xanthomonas campestris]
CPGIGLTAVGSSDANRFSPGRGTLSVRRRGEPRAGARRRFAA